MKIGERTVSGLNFVPKMGHDMINNRPVRGVIAPFVFFKQ